MLQGVDAAPGLLNLGGQQLAGLLGLSQFQHVRKNRAQAGYRVIQIAGGEGEAIREHIVLVGGPGVEGVDRDID